MKFLIFSDLHLNNFPFSNTNKKGENELFEAGLSIIDQLYGFAKENSIKYIFFLGDLFHNRTKIDSFVYVRAYEKIKEYFNDKNSPVLFILVGNHDQRDKEGNHTLIPFDGIRNVYIIDKNIKFYSVNFIFCPHNFSLEKLYTFLVSCSDEASFVFLHQLLPKKDTLNNFVNNDLIDTTRFKYQYIFSGHNHKPFKDEQLNLYNIGAPMHLNYGDSCLKERYFLYYNDGNILWIETKFPKFAYKNSEEEVEASYVKERNKETKKIENKLNFCPSDSIKDMFEKYFNQAKFINKKDLLKEGGIIINEVLIEEAYKA